MLGGKKDFLVLLNCLSIAALLAGFICAGKAKSCEEDRTRQVFFAQYEATAASVNMLLVPKKADKKTGDYDDSLYDVTERARRNKERFQARLQDGSCQPYDRGGQVALCLSAALQVLSGLLTALWNKD